MAPIIEVTKFNGKLSISDYSSDGYSAQSPYGSDLDDYEDDDYSNRTVDLSLGYTNYR